MPGEPAFEIRPERPSDRAAIGDLTVRAFAPMPYAAGDEAEIIERLRSLGVLSLSLVAAIGPRIVGHVAFSPALAADGGEGWFALGPISVEPELQRRGIGRALIARGFEALRDRGAHGCILVGDPGYYCGAGFEPAPQYAPTREPAEYFMLARFDQKQPPGHFDFHQAFYTHPGNAGA